MRTVRLTDKEVATILTWMEALVTTSLEDGPIARRIIEKLTATSKSAHVGPIEEALIAAADGKVVRLAGSYSKASVLAARVGASAEDATTIGRWLSRQSWFSGPTTLITILHKWGEWLPKARFEADKGTPGSRQGAAKSGRPEGFWGSRPDSRSDGVHED